MAQIKKQKTTVLFLKKTWNIVQNQKYKKNGMFILHTNSANILLINKKDAAIKTQTILLAKTCLAQRYNMN
jgi:hypothetical protein